MASHASKPAKNVSCVVISSDFEHERLGSVRVQLEGTTQFYGLPVSATVEAMHGSGKVSCSEAVSYMARLDQARLKVLKDASAPFIHGALEPGAVLVIPPGWIMSYATVGEGQDANVSGLFRSVLLTETLAHGKAQYETILAKNMDEKDQAWTQFLTTLVVAEMKKLPAGPDKRVEKESSTDKSAAGKSAAKKQAAPSRAVLKI